jgi:tetratricopeptide (TPR) repeat protein
MVMIAFVAVRYSILGTMRRLPPGAPGWAGALATVPSVLCFYSQKVVWPYPLGMAYGLRVVSNDNINWMNFWVPVVALAMMARGALYMLPKDRAYRVGLIWFLISILLALEVRVFLPEEIVHDRYLYLPLCGAILMLSQLIYDAARRIGKRSGRGMGVTVAGALAALLAVLAYQQNPTWANEVALWEQAAKTDPTSAHASAQYGEALRQAGKFSQARSELERSLALNPDLRTSNLALGMLAVAEKRFIEAERLLRHILAALPKENVARENLASCLQQQGRVSEAIALFDEGRKLLPYLNETYTINIAVLERNRGNTQDAIRELASIEDQMGRSLDPAVIRGLFFLGELYREAGNMAQASRAYAAFARQARESKSSELEPIRDAVEAALRDMPPQP